MKRRPSFKRQRLWISNEKCGDYGYCCTVYLKFAEQAGLQWSHSEKKERRRWLQAMEVIAHTRPVEGVLRTYADPVSCASVTLKKQAWQARLEAQMFILS